MKKHWDPCVGDRRPLLVLIIIIAIPVLIWCSPSNFILGWGHQFSEGYQDGDAAFFDGFPNLQNFLEHRQIDGEGYADYWDENNSFWYEQGFEEGYKKAAKTYWGQLEKNR